MGKRVNIEVVKAAWSLGGKYIELLRLCQGESREKEMRWRRGEKGLESQRVGVMADFNENKMINNNNSPGIMKNKRHQKSRTSWVNQREDSTWASLRGNLAFLSGSTIL